MPAYGTNSPYTFTKQFPVSVFVAFDNINHDPNSEFNVLVQCEPPTLYRDFAGWVKNTYQNFDLILTYDDRLLELPNAVEFCPIGSWIDDITLDKRNQITYLMSSKILTAEHRLRHMILRRYGHKTQIGDFEFYMYRSPPKLPSKNPFFENAKFHIVCENEYMNNMFTEKLIDCFKTYTIPIYFGCRNINKYFNICGILPFTNIDEFEHVISNLTPGVYDALLPFARKNYELARPYWEKTVYQRIEDEISKKIG